MSEAARAGTLTDTEREVSQRLSQGFAWPTVLLLVALIAIEGAVIAAWAAARCRCYSGCSSTACVLRPLHGGARRGAQDP